MKTLFISILLSITTFLYSQTLIFRCDGVQNFHHPMMSTKEASEKGLMVYDEGGTAVGYYIVNLDTKQIILVDSADKEKPVRDDARIYNVALYSDTLMDFWVNYTTREGLPAKSSFYYEKENNIVLIRRIKDGIVYGCFLVNVRVEKKG